MTEWRPNAGPQERFLSSSAYEVLYGGAAGGGKSDGLLVGALRRVEHPNYAGIVLRRTFPELEKSLIARSQGLYRSLGGLYNEQKHVWRFPSGARIYFAHLEHENSVHEHQSAEYQYFGFDELTSFTETQFRYMLSRARSSSGIPVRVRAASNPGGVGASWVMKRWAPWLDRSPEYSGPRVEPGRVLNYRNTMTGEEWCEESGPDTLSRVFIPAMLADNPHLAENDPQYVQRLMGLDPVTRAQLLEGDWLIQPAAGLYFKRSWFKYVDAPPAEAQRVRYWDRAASEQKDGNDPDWTVGLKLSRDADGLFCIEDVVRIRGTPLEVEKTIKATTQMDGRGVIVGIEEDPGSAGKFESSYYVRALAGFNVRTYRPTGDKVTRAGPASAQVERGNVSMVKGPWNERLVQELESFPSPGIHDDQVDALSGAVSVLAFPAPSLKGYEGFKGRHWRL